jgi:histidinol-phosphate aminotransferase
MFLRPEVKAAPAYNFTPHPEPIKLDQNESPYDLPSELKQEVLKKLESILFNRYPDLSSETLRKKMADALRWPETGMVVSGGSNVLIQAFVLAAGIGHQVLTVCPTFSVYPLQAKLLGSRLIECPLEPDFSLPLENLLQQLSNGQGVFFLANPAAPTGNVFSAQDLERLAEASKDKWLFVIDEAYHQFSRTDFTYLVKQFEHVASLRTFSKAFGLGGVRLGYGLMQPALAIQIQKLILPFSVSSLQAVIAESILERPDLTKARIEETLNERKRLMTYLENLDGLEVLPSQTNFFLMRVKRPDHVYKKLLEAGIVIRRQDHLPMLEGCLRVSIGTSYENNQFLDIITKIVGEA